ncbi:MAG: hypothetical protein EPO68_02075 [Planctomycetota bacterium]|nr:MAG: hypothetical protein EPO68_02075 [Planctomycetota bacterium]
MEPARPTAARRSAAWRKLALACGVLVLTLALAEIGYRIVAAARGRAYDAAETESAIRKVTGLVSQRLPVAQVGGPAGTPDPLLLLHPYFGFDVASAQPEIAAREQYFQGPESVRTFDVLIVGGSVAAHFEMETAGSLVRLLGEDPRLAGHPIRVHTFARGGIKQPQQLNQVAYLFCMGWKPDLVLCIDGFNELALSNHNAWVGMHPLHPSQPHWAHLATGSSATRDELDLYAAIRGAQASTERRAQRALALGLPHSALLGNFARGWVGAAAQGYYDAYRKYTEALAARPASAGTQGPPFPSEFPARLDGMVRAWSEASRSLHALCAARDCLFVHVLQPTLLDEGSKPLTQKERAGGTADPDWQEAVRNGYPKLRELGRALRARGIRFLDASMLFADVHEDLYYDACHFSTPGNERLAAAIAAFVRESLPQR